MSKSKKLQNAIEMYKIDRNRKKACLPRRGKAFGYVVDSFTAAFTIIPCINSFFLAYAKVFKTLRKVARYKTRITVEITLGAKTLISFCFIFLFYCKKWGSACRLRGKCSKPEI